MCSVCCFELVSIGSIGSRSHGKAAWLAGSDWQRQFPCPSRHIHLRCTRRSADRIDQWGTHRGHAVINIGLLPVEYYIYKYGWFEFEWNALGSNVRIYVVGSNAKWWKVIGGGQKDAPTCRHVLRFITFRCSPILKGQRPFPNFKIYIRAALSVPRTKWILYIRFDSHRGMHPMDSDGFGLDQSW